MLLIDRLYPRTLESMTNSLENFWISARRTARLISSLHKKSRKPCLPIVRFRAGPSTEQYRASLPETSSCSWLLCMSWPKHDNGHARERHQRARHVPGGRPNAFNSPEPEYCYKNIYPSIRGICPARSGRMEREQPCKQCKTAGGG